MMTASQVEKVFDGILRTLEEEPPLSGLFLNVRKLRDQISASALTKTFHLPDIEDIRPHLLDKASTARQPIPFR